MNTATLRPHQMSLQEAIVRIGDGRLTCEALVRDCLDRINERESQVQAWALLDPELAIRTAQQLDRTPRGGLLHGIPIGVKDVIETFDLPTAYGSPIYRDHRPIADAGCVAMARAAGAVILGKTVTAEFASSHPGNTTNPHNPAHTPGGSSSGSAAAVADFMVPLALGTQTGGSVIRPASFCGIIGFKPTFGLITRAGVKQLSDFLDTVGMFGRTVEDIAIFTAALCGRSEFVRIDEAAPPRVGLFCMDDWPPREAPTVEAVENARQLLLSRHCAMNECALPASFTALGEAHHEIEYFELARGLQHEFRCHANELTPGLSARIREGLRISGKSYEQALRLVHECRAAADHWFTDVDMLLAPSAPGEAPAGLATTGKATFNRMWTLLGLPAITLPMHRGPQGLPVGVQLIGRRHKDRRLLAHAEWMFRSATLSP